jgi:hypothetical protein
MTLDDGLEVLEDVFVPDEIRGNACLYEAVTFRVRIASSVVRTPPKSPLR